MAIQPGTSMAAAAGGGKTFSAKYEYPACCQLFLTIVGDCFIRDAESVIQRDKSNLKGGRDAALFTTCSGLGGACQCQCQWADTNPCTLLGCGRSPLQDLVCCSRCLPSCGICRNQARGQAVCHRAPFQHMDSRPDTPTFASHVRPSKPVLGIRTGFQEGKLEIPSS